MLALLARVRFCDAPRNLRGGARHELFKSVKNFLLIGVAPTVGGLALAAALVKSGIDLADPANSESGDSWLGLGPPLVIAIGFLILGVVLMLLQWRANPAFFRRKLEVVGPDGLAVTPSIDPDAGRA